VLSITLVNPACPWSRRHQTTWLVDQSIMNTKSVHLPRAMTPPSENVNDAKP
jgi:hypothetical protein